MKKLALYLLFLTGIVAAACNPENITSETVAGKATNQTQKENLEKIFQTVNSSDFRLDSAWILTNDSTGAHKIKLLGTKTVSGQTETRKTYISIKLNNNQFVPVPAGQDKVSATTCVSHNCNRCDLKDMWLSTNYCDCGVQPTKTDTAQCNMNTAFYNETKDWFTIPETTSGLLYPAAS